MHQKKSSFKDTARHYKCKKNIIIKDGKKDRIKIKLWKSYEPKGDSINTRLALIIQLTLAMDWIVRGWKYELVMHNKRIQEDS